MKDYTFLKNMYNDPYYPNFLVHKIEQILQNICQLFESKLFTLKDSQKIFDEAMIKINDLQEEFYQHDSEIETIARDTIAVDIEKILSYYNITIDLETAMEERDW